MSFYIKNQEMKDKLSRIISRYQDISGIDYLNKIAITWICYDKKIPKANSGIGAGLNESKLIYPASIVKIIYAFATEVWIQKRIISSSKELWDAVKDMIKDSSNDATSFVVDYLTGTSSGISLSYEDWENWKYQRNLIHFVCQSINFHYYPLLLKCFDRG